jgi:hypothetical protein
MVPYVLESCKGLVHLGAMVLDGSIRERIFDGFGRVSSNYVPPVVLDVGIKRKCFYTHIREFFSAFPFKNLLEKACEIICK